MDRRHFLAAGTAFLAAAVADGQTRTDLRASIEAIERRSGGRLGVAVHASGAGRRFAWRGDEPFPLCSTFKLLLVACLLAKADQGRERLSRILPVREADLLAVSPFTTARVGRGASLAELMRASILFSDNAAANLLLPAVGGPEGLTRWLRALGDPVTRLDRVEPLLGEAAPGDSRDTTAPAAMAADMQKILLGAALGPASRARLTAWLIGCRTGRARLRAGLPGGWRAGDKTGSGANGTANDVAILWPGRGRPPLLVAAYLTGARVDGALRDAALASVGRAVADAFS